MRFLYQALYFSFAFSFSFFSYADTESGGITSFFKDIFEVDKQAVEVDDWSAYYKGLKTRVIALKGKNQIVLLFTDELRLNPNKANEIIKVFVGKHPKFSVPLIKSFISASKRIQFPNIQSLPKDISKEIVGRLKPIKTLVVINTRELFNAELSDLINKYPQYPAQLLAYASKLDIVEQQSIVKLNSADITKHQVDFIKIEERPSYDMAIGLALVAAAIGGGGGDSSPITCGGGPCVPTSDKDSYETAEYTSQKGLGLVNASTMYSYGGTGEGIKVAVFDSGVYAAHTEFGTRVLSSDGYDYIGTGITTDENGHGTHVSGTIAAGRDGGGSGMQGVAYKAKIIPYKIGNAAGAILTTDAENKDSYTRAITKGARIFNNSWGSSVKITDASKAAIEAAIPLALAEMQVAIDAGAIFVWASGNNSNTEVSYRSGLPYHFPDMKKGYLAVTSVSTADGSSSSFANDCGVAAAWCISAPGGSVYSTWKDGAYKTISGTSMAAPHVSGALAGLKSRFPSLSYHQVRDRLLATADSTGIYVDTEKFGVGLMDLAAASSPVGVAMITLTADDDGSATASSSTTATFSSDVFSIFADKIKNNKIMLVDSFDRAAFYTDASAFIKSKKKSFNVDLESLFDQKNTINEKNVSYYTSQNGSVSLSGTVSLNSNSLELYWFAGNSDIKTLNKVLGLSDSINIAKNTSTGLSLQSDSFGKLGAWMDTSSDSSDDGGLIPLAIQNSVSISSLNTGLSLTKDFSINSNSLLTTGIAYGKPDALSNSLSSSGAFEVNAKDAIVSFASISSTLGQVSFDLTAQNTQINSVNDLSLFRVPEKISLNDMNAKISFESLDKNSQISLSMGATKIQGNSTSTLSIPVSVDESGSVSYLDMSTPTGALFNHIRVSLSAKTRVNDNLDLVGVISSYNPTLNKADNDQVVGIASRWKF